MATDVAAFARQLKEEGIDAARQEAEKITAEAGDQASRILDEAKSAARKLEKDAEDEILRKRQRSEAEIKLVARDLILNLKRQVEQVAADLLKKTVAGVLAAEEVVKSALIEVLRCQKSGKEWELALGPTAGKALANAVVEELFKEAGATVQLAEGFRKAGFELRGSAGTEVIEVSDESTTEAFRRLLSPELQKILDSKFEASK